MADHIDTLKREAKKLSRATSITHCQALDVLAVQRGYGHWGALADHLESMTDIRQGVSATSLASGSTAQDLLEHLLGMALPQLEGCRHIVISGATSTGKTTLLGQLVAAIPVGTRIACVADTPEIILPAGSTAVTASGAGPSHTDGDAIAEALSAGPDVLVVGEVTTTGAPSILAAMNRPGGPLVATTIHASEARDAAVAFAQRVTHAGRGRLPAGVAVVHVERDADGARRIAEVIRSR